MRIFLVLLALAATCLPGWQMAHANVSGPVMTAQADTAQPSTVKPGQLLLQRRKNAGGSDAAPTLTGNPVEWIKAQQRTFYSKMSAALSAMKRGSAWSAALTLMALSFAYGILHAAGPGHGKAVVSAWLLANERQLRRGVMISFMAALFQAVTADRSGVGTVADGKSCSQHGQIHGHSPGSGKLWIDRADRHVADLAGTASPLCPRSSGR